jgi:transcriptional regulator with XRE-family HTH domain
MLILRLNSQLKNDPETRRLLAALARAIRTIRVRNRGRTQEDLGDAMGVDRAYVGALERGRHEPRLTTFWKLAKGLGVSPACLAKEVERQRERNR